MLNHQYQNHFNRQMIVLTTKFLSKTTVVWEGGGERAADRRGGVWTRHYETLLLHQFILSHPILDFLYSRNTEDLFQTEFFSIDPILDQTALISILYPRLHFLKNKPFTAAHAHIHVAYIWEQALPQTL